MAEVMEAAVFLPCDVDGHQVDATLIAEIWWAAMMGYVVLAEPTYACVGSGHNDHHTFMPDYP